MNKEKCNNRKIVTVISSIVFLSLLFSISIFAKTNYKAVQEYIPGIGKVEHITRTPSNLLKKTFDNQGYPIDLSPVILNFKPKSILATNLIENGQPEETVKEIPVDAKIFDVSYIVYSKRFAEKYNLPEEYVVDLDPGMHVLEFKLFTDGRGTASRINILLDNDLGIDVPKQNYTFDRIRFNFPRKPGDSTLRRIERESDQEKARNYFNRNIRIATLDYEFRKQGGSSSLSMMSYSNTRFPNMDFFSIGMIMGKDIILKRYDVALWLKKRGAKDYTRHGRVDANDFVKFRLPRSFVKEGVVPALNMEGRHDSVSKIMGDWDAMKKVQARNKEKK